jgi:hypothetical protein
MKGGTNLNTRHHPSGIQCAEPVVEGGGGGRTRELGEFSFPSEPFKDNRIDLSPERGCCRLRDELLQLLLHSPLTGAGVSLTSEVPRLGPSMADFPFRPYLMMVISVVKSCSFFFALPSSAFFPSMTSSAAELAPNEIRSC